MGRYWLATLAVLDTDQDTARMVVDELLARRAVPSVHEAVHARDVERVQRELERQGRFTRGLELVLNTSRPRSGHDRSDGTLGPVPGDPQSDAIRVGRDHDPSRVRRRR
jgi:hypothetical protein